MKTQNNIFPASKQMRLSRRRFRFLPLALIAAGLCLALSAFSLNGFTLAEWWRESHSGVVRWRGATTDKCIALTFDDGPDPRYTPRVLAILRAAHAPATFFMEGRFVAKYPQLARSVRAEGHIIGNHTESHPYLNLENQPQVQREIGDGQAQIENVLRERPLLFRPPRGQWNPIIFREARRRHNHIILWDVALEHHDAPTPRVMVARALRLIHPGSVVLMHDGGSAPRDTTVAALPLLLDSLRAQGYRFVTVPELLHIKGSESL